MITYYTKEGKFKVYIYNNNLPINKLHREDGPAIIWNNGSKEWYINGVRHRTNGPAVIVPGYYKEWYVNSKLHRLDGPAVEWSDGEREYWINGKVIETLEVESWIKSNNINLKTKQHQALFMLRFW